MPGMIKMKYYQDEIIGYVQPAARGSWEQAVVARALLAACEERPAPAGGAAT